MRNPGFFLIAVFACLGVMMVLFEDLPHGGGGNGGGGDISGRDGGASPGSVARQDDGGGSLRRPAAPILEIAPSRRRPGFYTGTAFPIAPNIWMTARHVVEGCRVLRLIDPQGRQRPVERVVEHASADLALLRSPLSATGVVPDTRPLSTGERGYHFGFPGGRPGAVYSQLIGEAGLRKRDYGPAPTPVTVWAKQVTVPRNLDGFGGISGGPLFDRSGELVGVSVAGSDRRGRLVAIAMPVVAAFMIENRVAADRGQAIATPAADDLAAAEQRLRRQGTVAQVTCDAR